MFAFQGSRGIYVFKNLLSQSKGRTASLISNTFKMVTIAASFLSYKICHKEAALYQTADVDEANLTSYI